MGIGKERNWILFTKGLIDIMLLGGIGVMGFLPFLLKYYVKLYAPEAQKDYSILLIMVFLSGILGEWIILELRKMMNTVVKGECFVMDNVTSLRHMRTLAFGISLIYFLLLWILFRPIMALIIVTFFMAALFSHVLSIVFEEAVRCKEENDLTV